MLGRPTAALVALFMLTLPTALALPAVGGWPDCPDSRTCLDSTVSGVTEVADAGFSDAWLTADGARDLANATIAQLNTRQQAHYDDAREAAAPNEGRLLLLGRAVSVFLDGQGMVVNDTTASILEASVRSWTASRAVVDDHYAAGVDFIHGSSRHVKPTTDFVGEVYYIAVCYPYHQCPFWWLWP